MQFFFIFFPCTSIINFLIRQKTFPLPKYYSFLHDIYSFTRGYTNLTKHRQQVHLKLGSVLPNSPKPDEASTPTVELSVDIKPTNCLFRERLRISNRSVITIQRERCKMKWRWIRVNRPGLRSSIIRIVIWTNLTFSNLNSLFPESHGFSLSTVYRVVKERDPDCKIPVLLLIRDTSNHRFGAFLSEGPKLCEKSFGCGETFVFSLTSDKVNSENQGNYNSIEYDHILISVMKL
mgnify:CR=1 FL=1